MKTIYNFKGKKKKELIALMKHQIELKERELAILDEFLVPDRQCIKVAKDFLAGKTTLENYLLVAKKANEFYKELGKGVAE